MIVCSLWMVPTFGLPWATHKFKKSGVRYSIRGGVVFQNRGYFAGGMGLMS